MKRKAICRNAVSISATICVLATFSRWDIAAQRKTPKPSTTSPPPVKRTVPPKSDRAASEKLVNVATIHISDGSAAKVRKTFRAAKIPVLVMGSKNYGVLVREKDHDRALRILKADAKKQHYWIRLGR